jgi:hypothetical protein
MAQLRFQLAPTSPGTIIIGDSNFTSATFEQVTTCSVSCHATNFFTIFTTGIPLAREEELAPSEPLSAGAIRVVNSVLTSRVPEAAFRRE